MVQNPQKRFAYEKARLLRRRGLSYNEIKAKLGVSKSSVSLWCRDIKLSNKQNARLRDRSAAVFKLGAIANHEKRKKEIFAIKEIGGKEITILNRDAFKMLGAILYWCEGTKNQNTAVVNSDPRIIEFAVAWFKEICGVPPSQLKAYLHIHYGNDEKKIIKFWSQLTNIPLKNFGKTFIKPKGTGHRTNILPNGIIRIGVTGPGTSDLRHKIFSWAEKIYELSKAYQ
ncbi:MAG: hypothetical protein HY433_03590 [Candidatus Liptonbacteria bacterium]|nr:hypothetical protein [Candidatus Liptonbacteria bacterium]